MSPSQRLISAVSFALLLGAAHAQTLEAGDGKQWYKGNTHTHTLWSDGDGAPEVVVSWYVEHGYDFLALSDHNVFQDKEVWFPVQAGDRLTPERVEAIREQFGEDWVQIQENGSRVKMRLKTFTELQTHFEKPSEFILIPAEEVTSKVVHVNAINIRGVIPAAQLSRGETRRDLLRKNFDAIEAHGREMGVPVLAHLNHPNWNEGVTAEDIIAVGGERFFEVYNGHSGVRNWGDEKLHMPSTDRLWDIILAMRMQEPGDRPMYGMATDDSHEYFEIGVGHVNSGRGWVQVLANELTPNAIVESMKRGEFYGSTGVTLTRVAIDHGSYAVHIEAQPGVTYTTQFIGTPKKFDASSEPVKDAAGQPIPWATRIYSDDIGQVLKETNDNPAVYEYSGDELYVRAKIVSTELQNNPFAEGDHESAWTQPKRLP